MYTLVGLFHWSQIYTLEGIFVFFFFLLVINIQLCGITEKKITKLHRRRQHKRTTETPQENNNTLDVIMARTSWLNEAECYGNQWPANQIVLLLISYTLVCLLMLVNTCEAVLLVINIDNCRDCFVGHKFKHRCGSFVGHKYSHLRICFCW